MNAPASRPDPIPERYVRLLIWVGAVLLGLLIPLRILGQGFLPGDDTLRHVAKVISGKPWSEILLLNPVFSGDEHPGMHAILGAVYRVFHPSADGLVVFAVLAMFAALWVVLVAPRKRPEAMLAALFVVSLLSPINFERLFYGRPYLFPMIVCVILLQLWTNDRWERNSRLLVSVALLALSAWIHGSWFLWGIVCVAFALAGQWRKGFEFGLCVLAGTFLAGCFAGRPIDFPVETVRHLILSFGDGMLTRMLVVELQPGSGDTELVGIVLLVLVWRAVRGEWKSSVVMNPIFMLAALGWLLGLQVSRFWSDWGLPATLLWLAIELEDVLEHKASLRAYPRLLLAGFVAAGVYICSVRDVHSRWTGNLSAEFVTPETPGVAGWLPDKGGIVYSGDMNVFFRFFYQNPHADWRYALGFESAIMPEEDRRIFRNIQWNWYTGKSYEPWVAKMRAEDRMILFQTAGNQPHIPGLEWKYFPGDTWIGRLPRTNSVPAGKPMLH